MYLEGLDDLSSKQTILLYIALAKYCNEVLGTHVEPSKDSIEYAESVKGTKHEHNIDYPLGWEIKRALDYLGRFDVYYVYKFKDTDKCREVYVNKTKDQLLSWLEKLHRNFS